MHHSAVQRRILSPKFPLVHSHKSSMLYPPAATRFLKDSPSLSATGSYPIWRRLTFIPLTSAFPYLGCSHCRRPLRTPALSSNAAETSSRWACPSLRDKPTPLFVSLSGPLNGRFCRWRQGRAIPFGSLPRSHCNHRATLSIVEPPANDREARERTSGSGLCFRPQCVSARRARFSNDARSLF